MHKGRTGGKAEGDTEGSAHEGYLGADSPQSSARVYTDIAACNYDPPR